ncbi:hypothetical protein [Schaalia sp. ZJ1691]|nr:hypothetical protein [Schaalia sp. ZJ1691]
MLYVRSAPLVTIILKNKAVIAQALKAVGAVAAAQGLLAGESRQ